MKLRRQLASRSRKGELHKLSDGQALTSVFSRMLFVALLLLSANLNMPKTVGAIDKNPGARRSRAGADLARRQSQAAKSAGSADIRGVFARPASCVSTAAASAAPVADAAAAAAIVAAALATNISTPYQMPLFNRVEEGASANPHQPKEPASAPNGVRVYVACTPRPGLDPQPPLCLA